MNHTYRLVWNQEAQRYVPAPECAKGKGKTKALAPAAVILSTVLALPAWAQTSAPAPAANQLPTGGQVVSGSAHINQSGSQMQIQQGSQKAIIDWTSFNIGKDASVTFQQNNASAIALNRVTAGDASQIHGQLNANGQVWLINPNGVVFGQGSKVDVGGLVASTMNITNADFENGHYTFTRNGATGSITNQGSITAQDGGSIALLAPTVSNDGILRAQLGTVALAAGDKITLQAGANGLLNVEIDPATIRTLVENKQLIVADGGQVIMTGRAADQLSSSVVANTGTIQANRLQEKDGKILLIADMQHGETQAAGKLEAHFIDTSAATVSIDKDLHINTAGGQWLIDPVDITIDQSKATAIETALGTGNVTISTADGADNGSLGSNGTGTGTDAGDITVDAAITWDKATELILRADNNIAINASITAKNANGKLALLYGQGSGNGGDADYAINMSNGASVNLQSGQNFSTQKGSSGSLTTYAVVNDAAALKSAMAGSGSYALGSHLDLSGVAWAWSGSSPNLSGKFDGLGHTLKNLSITSTLGGYTGLFGTIAPNADLRHIGLVNANISVSTNTLGPVGGLAGQNLGSIRRAYVTGQISSSTSNAPGQVALVGGLVGGNLGSISDSYSTAQVTVSNATSIAAGSSFAGGLVGQNNTTGSIRRSYATGKVSVTTTGGIFAGGLVGMSSGSIDQTYAIGQVQTNKAGSIGGLVGVSVTVTNSFWDTQTTGQTTSAGGTGKTTAEMQQAATYAGWDFGNTWRIVDTGAGTEGYAFYGLPTLQGVTPKTDYQYFDSGTGTSANPWTLANWQQLQNINFNTATLAGHYQMTADLDKDSAGYGALASATANGSQGWKPLGDGYYGPFNGSFDGQDHTISDLNINRPSQDYVGLFGYIQNATLRNLGLLGGSIKGQDKTGGLVGSSANSTISHSYTTGNTTGASNTGGLVGISTGGSISQSYATGSTTGSGNNTGGLVGYSASTISQSYATGNTEGGEYTGGLVGISTGGSGSISQSYATGNTTGSGNSTGGLVGISQGSILQSYATGNTTGSGFYTGGLVGENYSNISHSYATGNTTGSGNNTGGLVGASYGNINNSFYATTNANGDEINQGAGYNTHGTGKTTAQLADWNTFTGWDSAVWGTTQTGDASVAGYQARSSLPFLNNLTREQDKAFHTSTLFSGGLGVDGNAWTVGSWQQLQNINFNTSTLGGHYQMTADLDKDSAGYGALASATANGSQGWKPLGNFDESTFTANAFKGTFDGQGYTISDLSINRPTQNYVGLFGYAENATLRNVGVVGGSITGYNNTGGLVGYNTGSNISHSYTTGNTTGNGQSTGGLVGYHNVGSISQSYATGNTTGRRKNTGGLVGVSQGSILQSYATGNTEGSEQFTGGLVGASYTSTISQSYATGSTTSSGDYTGGLLGLHNGGSISQSYATGNTTGSGNYTGGLVGASSGNINNSFYATTNANGDEINQGGGYNAYGTVKTYAELQQLQTFADAGWDIDDAGGTGAVWRIYEGQSGPLLRGFLKQVTVTADAGSITGKTYDGTAASGTASYTTDVTGAVLEGNLGYATNSKNAGDYSTANGTLTVGGLHSGQQGYDISYASTNASLTIAQKALTVTGMTAGNKTYDGGTVATVTGGSLSGVLGSDTVTLGSSTGTFADKNVGTGKTVTASGITLDGADAGNYTVTQPTGLTADITAKALTVTGMMADNKTYDGGTVATVTGGSLSGIEGSDTVTLGSSTGTFADKNAGTGKTVTVSGITLDGADAGNYTVTQPTGLTADIGQAALQITASDANKTQGNTLVLNGSTGFTVDAGLVAGEAVDSVQLSSPGTPASAAVGSYAITASNATGSSGFDANNYAITYNNGSLMVTASAVTPPVTPPVEPPAPPVEPPVPPVEPPVPPVEPPVPPVEPPVPPVEPPAPPVEPPVEPPVPPITPPVTPPVPPQPPASGLPSGGMIWLSQQEGGLATQTAGAGVMGRVFSLEEGSTYVASSGVPHLMLTPGFIRLDEDEAEE